MHSAPGAEPGPDRHTPPGHCLYGTLIIISAFLANVTFSMKTFLVFPASGLSSLIFDLCLFPCISYIPHLCISAPYLAPYFIKGAPCQKTQHMHAPTTPVKGPWPGDTGQRGHSWFLVIGVGWREPC